MSKQQIKIWKQTKVTELDGFYTTYPGTAILEKRLSFGIGAGRHIINWSDLLPMNDVEIGSTHGRPGKYRITVEVEIPYVPRRKAKS